MKGREKMIAVLEIIRCAAAVVLLVVLTMYVAYRVVCKCKRNCLRGSRGEHKACSERSRQTRGQGRS